MVIANATVAQAANAIQSFATVCGVIDNPDQDHRRARLKALLAQQEFAGNKAQLGRAIGYSSGAFVRQMLDAERPITEKTVEAIHAMRGGKYKGWFDSSSKPREHEVVSSVNEWPFDPYLTREDWETLDAGERAIVAHAAKQKMKTVVQDRPAAPSRKLHRLR